MIGTITLNPSIDQNLLVRRLIKDDANRAKAVFLYPGGKGVNVSKVVRELGGRTRAYALIGGAAGELWKELITNLDIPFCAVKISGDTRINTVLTDSKDATQTRVSAPGPRVSAAELARLLRLLCGKRPRPFLWALGGSLAAGMHAGVYRDLIQALQKTGTPCVLDTDNEALRLGIAAKPFMIKPNEFEMRRLVGHPLKSTHDYLAAARSIVAKGVRIVVVSLGARGALFVSETDSFFAHGVRVPVKSKVGAGDSLIGGFVLGLLRRRSLRDSARMGIAASTSAVMREAPRLCRRSDMAWLIRRVRIEPLR